MQSWIAPLWDDVETLAREQGKHDQRLVALQSPADGSLIQVLEPRDERVPRWHKERP
jgi:hypothetical protein